MAHQIHNSNKQDHLGNHRAIRKVTGELVTTSWTTEYLEHLFSAEYNNAGTKSKVWSRSSRTTNIKNHSFRIWARRRRSKCSAKNRRTWSPTWTTPRSSHFANILPNSNVPCLLGNSNNLLQPGKKYEVYAESNRVRPEQPWRHLNPWICDQEKQQSWSEAQTFWKTKDVLPGETDA